MSTSKNINKICLAVIAIALVITILFCFGQNLGIAVVEATMPYESKLFDTSYVHSIDIVMNDWDDFITNCESEEYSSCTVVVDGEKHSNIAIRAKGNTSLSSVKSMGSQRYSFKLEFDHYEAGKTLDGLDKLCLNNLIQDNTMMKDYIAYQLMRENGVDAPLCSFAYITVNGEDWGLYLAVEGIEDSFLERNYGAETGELYKPDSLSFGGGRGNGKDFNMDDFDFTEKETNNTLDTQKNDDNKPNMKGQMPDMQGGMQMPDGMSMPTPQGNASKGGGGMGMGSDDVKLKYIDDDPESYSNIFDNAKTEITKSDKERLIASLKDLSNYENLEDVVDIEEVISYFVVHNFVCNGDSYTGSMIHNYYLHEQDGKLGMIPWDYNLAFGTFQGGNASSTVNSNIDEPVSGDVDDRPMVGWIFSDDKYTNLYHDAFTEFTNEWISSGKLETMISDTAALLRPYVEKDPTKFCTLDEFNTGVDTLSKFVSLRGQAVINQLNGDTTQVETGDLNLSDMGSMGGGKGDFDPGSIGGGDFEKPEGSEMPNGNKMPEGFGGNGESRGDEKGNRKQGDFKGFDNSQIKL